MVPTTARPTFIPDRIAPTVLMSGRWVTTSSMAAATSTARSMTAPEAAR